jgi:hypothetical protein
MVTPLDGALVDWASPLFIVGAVAMSSVCYLAAWRKPMRHLFFSQGDGEQRQQAREQRAGHGEGVGGGFVGSHAGGLQA